MYICNAPTQPSDGPLGLQASSWEDDIALISDAVWNPEQNSIM